ncbi:MAG: type IV toxin-antitoxin system AbiEi family antitoxin domain-containing protein [Fermentimonas sp.]|jgi:predicted transcriptional regulator of viral defense system
MEKLEQPSYNYLERHIDYVRSQGRYSFTLVELQQEFNISYRALKQGLYRLKLKKAIVQIRQGFYVIIPPEYSSQGMLPSTMFIDDLMKSLNKLYYISHFSAAAMFGAAHQQPMAFTITTKTPAPRSINNKKIKINFYSKKEWPIEGVVQKKTNAGFVNVSIPELTALDLLEKSHIFGINRIATILNELSGEMNSSNVIKIASQFTSNAALQRLGFILEEVVTNEKLAESLWKVLNKRKFSTIPLSPKKEKLGTSHNRWKVIENMIIESDL